MYGVMGCVVRPSMGRGGVKVEGKGKDLRVETTRLNNLGWMESGGDLLLSFVLVGSLLYVNSNIIGFLFGA